MMACTFDLWYVLKANMFGGLGLEQSNNEKLLENPYLQMLGILQLSGELETNSLSLRQQAG